MRRTAALIAGGGPAGSAAAIALAQGGVRALLIERSRETGDALCGGFLSWRSLETLDRLGIDRAALGGHPIARVRILSESAMGEAALPGPAIGVSRHRLDSLLIARAERAGAAVERGIAIRSAGPGQVRLGDDAILGCSALFLATGKHECRGLARPRDAGGGDPALGLRLRLPASPALARLIGDAIELHLFRGGYAGLLLQEDGSANLCMVIRKSRLAEADGDPWRLLDALARASPALSARLAFANRAGATDAIGWVPYGWRATRGVAGLFRLGDQAAVIPSLAGEGMGIALASGQLAAAAFLAGGPAAGIGFQPGLARRTARPLRIAGIVRDIAEARSGRRAAPHLIAALPGLAALLGRITRIP